MVSFKAVVAFLALAKVVLADYSITSPIAGTVWQLGSSVVITWIATNSNETTTAIKLLEGLSTALQPVQDITTTVNPTSGTFTWTVPTTLTPNVDYAISIGNAPAVFYSHNFTIAAAGQTAVTVSSTPAVSGANSSAAASTATGSYLYTPPSVASSSASAASASIAPAVSTKPASTSTSATSATAAATTSAKASGAEAFKVNAKMLALIPVAIAALYFL
ncbi:Ser-Thr-rich glycosyl-phosphatidyl-inositol-anchored membrane family-domain-containing protein [Jimgerdemannia flammicorona]|uniref:Ser-Thr-rich glycosyl-phosphatidyl-inositol-anchored membrane family-domain-containing protein n=2 Tax=Jimgerdemannia flammicorona TaxID=994334 RepID=A0A433Q5Z9_9FUNG|nr:Ser-Thr-rich glycosyl-phosphatidyl-inositol-anchored membrane family-domain-containing protein [Jimgerdemannia flammicorona]RUS25197.1 Ser-Thr-rich glycosyl-phosphatidyl-inositol-anchored membrane family-domain-containing protein [Jimgerdemannia flammicorona]